jgi:hypothetical protein
MGWITTYAAIAAGEIDLVTSAVRDLTGHEPRRLEEVLRADPNARAHLAA